MTRCHSAVDWAFSRCNEHGDLWRDCVVQVVAAEKGQTSYALELRPKNGVDIATTCRDAQRMADLLQRLVRFSFNDTQVMVHPGADPQRAVDAYWAANPHWKRL